MNETKVALSLLATGLALAVVIFPAGVLPFAVKLGMIIAALLVAVAMWAVGKGGQ